MFTDACAALQDWVLGNPTSRVNINGLHLCFVILRILFADGLFKSLNDIVLSNNADLKGVGVKHMP